MSYKSLLETSKTIFPFQLSLKQIKFANFDITSKELDNRYLFQFKFHVVSPTAGEPSRHATDRDTHLRPSIYRVDYLQPPDDPSVLCPLSYLYWSRGPNKTFPYDQSLAFYYEPTAVQLFM